MAFFDPSSSVARNLTLNGETPNSGAQGYRAIKLTFQPDEHSQTREVGSSDITKAGDGGVSVNFRNRAGGFRDAPEIGQRWRI